MKTAWVFDVDGVISHPLEKRVTEPEILDELIKKLRLEEPVALNTGRSISWIKDKILNELIERIKNKEIFQNLLIVGEKGGTWAEFDRQHNLIENIDKNISVPDSLKNKIRNLIKDKYSNSMFYDESKLTMISTEIKDGHSLNDYREKQSEINEEFKSLLRTSNLEDKFKIDSTIAATDIENKFVGKHFAARRILEWIKNKKIKIKKYITVGDSFNSDLPMAQEIYSQGLPVEFVYVGKENIDISKYPFPIKITQNKFEKGTLEFLKSSRIFGD